MFITFHLARYSFGPFIHHPCQSITKKKALCRIQTCNNYVVFELVSSLKSLISHYGTSKIGNIFTLCKFPVNMKTVNRNIFIELFDNHFCLAIELNTVIRRPPVLKVPQCIIFASLIVKAMGNLMSESGSYNRIK